MIVIVNTTRVLTESQYVLLVTTRDILGGRHIRTAPDHTAIWFDHADEGETFHEICLRNKIAVHLEH